jgi:hypothetical protein
MQLRIGLVGATALTLVATGCGGSSKGVSASSYVHVVCTTVKTFETNIQKQSSDLQTSVEGSGADADSIKKATSNFLGQAKSDSDAASSAINNAGVPNVSNGKKVQSTLISAFSQLSRGFANDQNKINALSTSDPTTFGQQLQKIGTDSQNLASSIGTSLEGTNGLGGELDQAGQNDAACKSL